MSRDEWMSAPISAEEVAEASAEFKRSQCATVHEWMVSGFGREYSEESYCRNLKQALEAI